MGCLGYQPFLRMSDRDATRDHEHKSCQGRRPEICQKSGITLGQIIEDSAVASKKCEIYYVSCVFYRLHRIPVEIV